MNLQIAYTMISNWYGDRRATRSGVRLMNHIDEGLVLLTIAPTSVHIAFALHPLYQDPKDRATNIVSYLTLPKEIRVLIDLYNNTMQSCSSKGFAKGKLVDLTTLWDGLYKDEVLMMCLADKLQNQKDFYKYHWKVHPESDNLEAYFEHWITKLTKTNIHKYLGLEKYCCAAKQYSDHMSCIRCDLAWDINDTHPPKCGVQ